MSTVAQRRRGRWTPGLIALAALLGIGIFFGAGGDLTHPPPTTLSGTDVASQISLGIQAQRGLASPPAVSCPAHEPVRNGFTFLCTLQAAGTAKAESVDVVEIDGRGHLRWSISGT